MVRNTCKLSTFHSGGDLEMQWGSSFLNFRVQMWAMGRVAVNSISMPMLGLLPRQYKKT